MSSTYGVKYQKSWLINKSFYLWLKSFFGRTTIQLFVSRVDAEHRISPWPGARFVNLNMHWGWEHVWYVWLNATSLCEIKQGKQNETRICLIDSCLIDSYLIDSCVMDSCPIESCFIEKRRENMAPASWKCRHHLVKTSPQSRYLAIRPSRYLASIDLPRVISQGREKVSNQKNCQSSKS